jgi:hypothetical protein
MVSSFGISASVKYVEVGVKPNTEQKRKAKEPWLALIYTNPLLISRYVMGDKIFKGSLGIGEVGAVCDHISLLPHKIPRNQFFHSDTSSRRRPK